MQDWLLWIISGLVAYLIGNISMAYIIGKIAYQKDIRKYGSGNAGTTNMMRTFGKKMGFLTFFTDAAKGVLAIFVGRWIAGDIGGWVASVMVVVGHNWPILLGFKGGKGIATSAGVIITTNPLVGGSMLGLGVILILCTRMVSIGSLVGSIGSFIMSLIVVPDQTGQHIVFALLAVLAIISHRENIKRILSGTENKLNFEKLKP